MKGTTGDINGDRAPDALTVTDGELSVLFNAVPNASPASAEADPKTARAAL